MRSSALLVVLLAPAFVQAQTYIDRAEMARDPAFVSRVGVAAQQQAIIVEGEAPETCCQTTTQATMASSSGKQIIKTLCDVIRPNGDPNAAEALKQLSRDRHTARLRFASQVIANAPKWSGDMAAIIASDACGRSTSRTRRSSPTCSACEHSRAAAGVGERAAGPAAASAADAAGGAAAGGQETT